MLGPSNIIFLNLLTGQIKCKEQFEMIRGLDENDVINIAIGDAIKAVWTDPGKSLYPPRWLDNLALQRR